MFSETFSRCNVGVLIQYLGKSEDFSCVGYGILFFPDFPFQDDGLIIALLNAVLDVYRLSEKLVFIIFNNIYCMK